jgi:hypothetical protein
MDCRSGAPLRQFAFSDRLNSRPPPLPSKILHEFRKVLGVSAERPELQAEPTQREAQGLEQDIDVIERAARESQAYDRGCPEYERDGDDDRERS